MTSDFAIAVHALVYLNRHRETISSEQLAQNVCTHPVRIRRVLAKLRKSGLAAAQEGFHGGFRFVLEADEISLQQIAQALHETAVDVRVRTGDMDMDCAIASGMAPVMDDVYARLNQACSAVLQGITLKDIDQKIFLKAGEENGKI